MIAGTSKVWSKSGPGDPPDYHQNASKNTKKYGIIMGKYYFCQSETSKISKKNRKMYVLGTRFSRFCCSICLFFVLFFGLSCDFWLYILKIILRRWGLKNATFSITKQHTDLDMNFISIKKHEMVFWYFCYFQVRFTLKLFMFKEGTLNFLIFKKGNHKILISR